MKFSLFALPAITALAWAAPTSIEESNAVEKRVAGGTLTDWLLNLNEELKPFTSHMIQVSQSVPQGASDADKQAAAQSIMGDIAAIRTAIQSTTAKVQSVGNQKREIELDIEKRQTLANITDVLGQLNGQPIVLARLLLPIIQQLNPALGSVLNTLSLTSVYVALQPLLTAELPALVTALGTLVNGLLVALGPLLAGVGGILAPILLGLGL